MELPVLKFASEPASPREILGHLGTGGPAVVALSGGADSGVVAWLAREALGDEARAVTFSGPAVSSDEFASAKAVANWIGIRHAVLPSDPTTIAAYRANPSNRCYFCRGHEARLLRAWANGEGISRILDGIHLDDLGEDRPGLRAMNEGGFDHPLAWGGWRKNDVRAFARSVGLPNAERPSDACLASRVRTGEPISPELLDRIAQAEARIRARGFRRVRVRSGAGGARVEVDPTEVERLLAEPLASTVRREVGELGFGFVTLDPVGYRWRPAA
ncbi:MAG: ATP-dependent sacrificial sulfur transferase LarE [Thermoplasmata archaeon]|nr:ATP-dependent sacrificial sulfur transferase LarE [Thermoplasmata archaeon]